MGERKENLISKMAGVVMAEINITLHNTQNGNGIQPTMQGINLLLNYNCVMIDIIVWDVSFVE